MIIYVEDKCFPHRTFITTVQPQDKVARIRAQLLHILFEIGRESYQFRLYYDGQYLRDSSFIEDYEIVENTLIKMVAMNRKDDISMDNRSTSSSAYFEDIQQETPSDVRKALYEEIKIFDRREKFIKDFKALLYVHFLGCCLALLTSYWYSVFWTSAVFLFGILLCPTYTRLGGYVGNNTHLKEVFCVGFGILALAHVAVSVTLSSILWTTITNHGCKDWEFVDDCSHRNVYSAIFFCIQALLLLISGVVCCLLFFSFKTKTGDKIEAYLVQERDIEELIRIAKSGKLKEKRTAAYELAAMASSTDDNKFRIVAEGGLDVLIALALSQDELIQEYSVEALAELLTIPSVQDTFVNIGGVKTLTALLHSQHSRTMQEAASALYNIVSDSEENKIPIIANHGLEDLAHAAYNGNLMCQRLVTSIMLELAFNPEVRMQMASRNIPGQALIFLCRSDDPETQRFALQTLELLAIESADMICAQDELLELLIDLPLKTVDEKLYMLASKILLYFAENLETCRKMLNNGSIRESLQLYAHIQDPILQKVIIKLIYCCLEVKELKLKSRELKLDRVLTYILENSADRDTWEMADQALQAMNSDDDLSTLPTLSTLDKVNKMSNEGKEHFGSRTSLRSSGRSSLISGGSTESDQKTIK